MGNRFKTFIVLAMVFLFAGIVISPVMADQSKVVLVGGGQAYKPLDDFLLEGELVGAVAGESWYVDSGKSASGDGKSWDYAVITLNEAIDLATADNGDVIKVAPGHAEDIDAVTVVIADVDGITVIGYGEGAQRPTFSWADDSDATILVTGSDFVLKNMIFDGSSTSTDAPDDMFYVTAAGFQLIGSKIITGDSTEAVTLVITGSAAADRMKVIGNQFTGSTDTGTTAAITFTGAADDIEIAYNTFNGDYSSAAIYSASAILDVNIHHNYIYNFNDDDHAIEISSNTATGVIAYNMLVTDAYATALDSGGLDVFETYWANDEIDDVMATPVFTHEDGAVLWSATELAAIESEVNDALLAIGLGRSATRTSDTLPQTGTETIFDVTNGPVRVLELVGEVTVVIGGASNNLKISIDPTTGAATDMATVLDIANDLDGSFMTMTGSFGSIVVNTAAGGADGMSVPYIVPMGIITITTDASGTGEIAWFIRYEPLAPGATVTANGP